MADNVAITAGAGTVIATDDVGGVQFQRVKLDIGGDGVSVPVTTALPVSIAAPVAVTGAFFQTTQPVSIAAAVAVTPPTNATTTRVFNFGAAIRQAFTATSTAAIALPTLGATREIRFAPGARCWIRFGDSGVAAAEAAANSFPLEANYPELFPVPVGATHFRIIRDTADGSIHMTPVA